VKARRATSISCGRKRGVHPRKGSNGEKIPKTRDQRGTAGGGRTRTSREKACIKGERKEGTEKFGERKKKTTLQARKKDQLLSIALAIQPNITMTHESSKGGGMGYNASPKGGCGNLCQFICHPRCKKNVGRNKRKAWQFYVSPGGGEIDGCE